MQKGCLRNLAKFSSFSFAQSERNCTFAAELNSWMFALEAKGASIDNHSRAVKEGLSMDRAATAVFFDFGSSHHNVEGRDNGSCICFLWNTIPLCDICRLRRELGGVH